MDFIFETAKERTVIYTAHKLKTLLYADKILYLKKGKIEDFGKTEEVIRRNRYFEKYTDKTMPAKEKIIEGIFLNRLKKGNLSECDISDDELKKLKKIYENIM